MGNNVIDARCCFGPGAERSVENFYWFYRFCAQDKPTPREAAELRKWEVFLRLIKARKRPPEDEVTPGNGNKPGAA